MIVALGVVVVVVFAGALITQAIVAWVAPERARAFLGQFASSFKAHVTEQVLRLIIGFGLVGAAPRMLGPRLVEGLGWIMVITSIGLLVLPWRWHHRFAGWVIPPVLRHVRLYGLGSGLLGVVLFFALMRPLLG